MSQFGTRIKYPDRIGIEYAFWPTQVPHDWSKTSLSSPVSCAILQSAERHMCAVIANSEFHWKGTSGGFGFGLFADSRAAFRGVRASEMLKVSVFTNPCPFPRQLECVDGAPFMQEGYKENKKSW